MSSPTIFAVVLAAGSASRFGRTKQLESFGGRPLVQRAAGLARDACGVNTVLVVGHDWHAVTSASDGACQFLVVNERHDQGLGASIACGVRPLRHCADAVLLLLADQPLITPDHLRAMRDAWSGAGDEIVATAFADTIGPPVLFPRGALPELAKLESDRGARKLLEDGRYKLVTIRFEPAATDVDTPADLQ